MSAKPGRDDVVITSVQFTAKVNIGSERTDWWNDQRKDELARWHPQASPMGMEFHHIVDDKPTGRVTTVPWAQVLVWVRGPRVTAEAS